MATVTLTSNLRRHLGKDAQAISVDARTVRSALEAVFAEHPALEAQVLDPDGTLWRHVTIFVGDRQIEDRETLSDPVDPSDEVHVMQSLAGG